MHRNLTVTQTAEKFGIHPNTLKNWEQQGLLVKPERDSTNRRIYTPELQAMVHDILREKERKSQAQQGEGHA